MSSSNLSSYLFPTVSLYLLFLSLFPVDLWAFMYSLSSFPFASISAVSPSHYFFYFFTSFLTLLLFHTILSLLSLRYLYFLQTLSSRQYSPNFTHHHFSFLYLYPTLFSLFHFFILSPFLQLFQFSFFSLLLTLPNHFHMYSSFLSLLFSIHTQAHTHTRAGAHSISLLWLSTYVVFLFPLSKHSFHYSATTTPTPVTRH